MSEIVEYCGFNGRRKITSTAKSITRKNVVKVLGDSLVEHRFNQAQIKYLHDYLRGKQPIKNRKKEVRPEILRNTVENTAYEIFSFKSSYLLGEPCTYISRSEASSDEVSKLNDYMFLLDKAKQDKELSDWITLCGVGYRIVLPATQGDPFYGECPFIMGVLDPRNTFCVYNVGITEKKLMSVVINYTNNEEEYTVYTDNTMFVIKNSTILKEEPVKLLNFNPIVEYRGNSLCMGAFEPVLDLLNGLNVLQSNRIENVEQIVQAFLKFVGCKVDEEVIQTLQDHKILMLPDGTDCDYVTAPLDQTQIQVLVDYIYSRILTITGLPATQNGGASTSDTGVAVMYRDGWQQAESNAKDTEIFFKSAEKETLRLALKICKMTSQLELNLVDIETKFTRRQYEASLSKAQTLDTMLRSGVAPEVAFPICGLFYDPTDAYEQSKEDLERTWNNEEGN